MPRIPSFGTTGSCLETWKVMSRDSPHCRASSRSLCKKPRWNWAAWERFQTSTDLDRQIRCFGDFDHFRLYMYAFMTHCDVCLRVGEPLGGAWPWWPKCRGAVVPWWRRQEPNLWFWNPWRWPRSQRWTQHSSRSWRICSGKDFMLDLVWSSHICLFSLTDVYEMYNYIYIYIYTYIYTASVPFASQSLSLDWYGTI